jgi:formylglycine-generating enzyme required for sulfatase activity
MRIRTHWNRLTATQRRVVLLLLPAVVLLTWEWLLPHRLHRPVEPGLIRFMGDVGGIMACEEDMRVTEGHPATDPVGCMIRVPAGRFLMGAQSTDPEAPGHDPEAAPDEGPVHQVTLPSFWIHRNEVTVHQYKLCVEAGDCAIADIVTTGGSFNYGGYEWFNPANGVTWEGARRYCAFIGGRLPTEAEWEYAARGPLSERYPWGEQPASCAFAVLDDGSGSGCGRNASFNVQMYARNDQAHRNFRLFHMSGNVWEWVADWYDPTYYARSPGESPRGPETGVRRVHRGGSWTDPPERLRASARSSAEPGIQIDDIGFRCAADRVASRTRLRQWLTDRYESFRPPPPPTRSPR